MKTTFWTIFSVMFVFLVGGTLINADVPAIAADQDTSELQTQAREQKRIYGSQLMTTQERAEHRTRMLNANTAEERERIRLEHHERMQERAREQGITLPDNPPDRGMGFGMGPGYGMGRGVGYGPGSGMGPGGRNR